MLKHKLEYTTIPKDVIASILKIEEIGKTLKDEYAQAYAKNLERSFDEYGTEGLKTQVMYFLNNAKGWRGDEAKTNKAILNKWTKF